MGFGDWLSNPGFGGFCDWGDIRVPVGCLGVSGFAYCLCGLYFHMCESPTLLNCFGQVMHILGIKIALIFPICTSVFSVSLFRPYKFGIVLKLTIVRVVQG